MPYPIAMCQTRIVFRLLVGPREVDSSRPRDIHACGPMFFRQVAVPRVAAVAIGVQAPSITRGDFGDPTGVPLTRELALTLGPPQHQRSACVPGYGCDY